MKKASKISSILLSLCEIAVAVLLLIDPIGFTSGIIIALGAVLVILGAVNIVNYFRDEPADAMHDRGLTIGILQIIGGIFCVLKSEWFMVTFPIVSLLYGIGTLVVGVSKLQWAVDMLRLKVKRWYLMAISSALTIVLAVIILCNPFGTALVVWTFIAISLIVEAVVDIIATIFTK